MTKTTSDSVIVGVKFSDFNAMNQYLLNRAALTITAVGLTATAAGSISGLIPDLQTLAPGARPVLVYLAAFFLPLAGLSAFGSVPYGLDLTREMYRRLHLNSKDKDDVSPEFRIAFMARFSKRLKLLRNANFVFSVGGFSLLVHVYSLFLLKLLSNTRGTGLFVYLAAQDASFRWLLAYNYVGAPLFYFLNLVLMLLAIVFIGSTLHRAKVVRANEMIEILGPDQKNLLHISSGDLSSLRNALKGSQFETMEARELARTAQAAVRQGRWTDQYIPDVVLACSIEHASAKKPAFAFVKMHQHISAIREIARHYARALSDGIVEVTGSIPVGSTNE
jgi:hypothetical protein